jgi:hypothetical protein
MACAWIGRAVSRQAYANPPLSVTDDLTTTRRLWQPGL